MVVFFTQLLFHPGFASELQSTADVLESGHWQLSLYERQAKEKPVVKISGTSEIQVPTSGGASTIFSQENAKVTLESEMSATVAMVTFRPFDGMHYRVKFGQVDRFKLDFSSGSWTNSLESLGGGIVWGAGVRWNIQPVTIVTTGIAIDLSYTNSTVELDKFSSVGTISSTHKRFESQEFQGALNVSRRWKPFEPYGGLKVSWLTTRLVDLETKGKVGGTDEKWSPFVGLKWEVFPHENVLVEASFVDEKSISAGMNVRF